MNPYNIVYNLWQEFICTPTGMTEVDDILVAEFINYLNTYDFSYTEGCPLCKKPEVLAHWQNMLKEYERFMMETENQIALRKIEEWMEVIGVEDGETLFWMDKKNYENWLQQDGEK